jgi:hypothetical protein
MLTQDGITEMRSAAVVDASLISLKLTETLVDLYRANIPIISRNVLFEIPASEDIREAIALLS